LEDPVTATDSVPKVVYETAGGETDKQKEGQNQHRTHQWSLSITSENALAHFLRKDIIILEYIFFF
jgi:hypothetical protein